MKKRVFYIPTSYYLSNPVFFNVAKAGERFQNIYFNTKDPAFAIYNEKGIKQEEIYKYFDEYLELDDSLFLNLPKRKRVLPKVEGYKRRVRGLLEFHRYKSFQIKLEKQLRMLNPDAMVTTSDMGGIINRMCNVWAERNKVPFIIIQPSFININRVKNPVKARLYYLIYNVILNIPIYRKQTLFGNERSRNHLFLWGEYFKKFYSGLEIEKNISLTGNPGFDPILNREHDEINSYDFGFDRSKGKPIITICTQETGKIIDKKDFCEITSFYKSLIRENADLYFVIKVHPREDVNKYKKIFDDLDKCIYTITKDVSLQRLFKVTKVQVSIASTSSFEAVIFGIPIVLVNPGNRIKLTDHFRKEIELRATTAEELSKHVRRCLSQKYLEEFRTKRKKYLKSRLTSIDGKSGERVVNKILEKINQSATK